MEVLLNESLGLRHSAHQDIYSSPVNHHPHMYAPTSLYTQFFIEYSTVSYVVSTNFISLGYKENERESERLE